MIDIRLLRPLVKAIGVRRETQRHLDCLTRQIAPRAAPVLHRLYHRELFDRFAFERWVELDTIACRLAMHEQVIGAFQHRDCEPLLHPAR